MNPTILQAIARPMQPGTFREAGFVQGVIYGKSIESATVKFEVELINKVIAEQGKNPKVTVEFAGVTMNGFIKEVQRSVMLQAVTHVDIQILA